MSRRPRHRRLLLPRDPIQLRLPLRGLRVISLAGLNPVPRLIELIQLLHRLASFLIRLSLGSLPRAMGFNKVGLCRGELAESRASLTESIQEQPESIGVGAREKLTHPLLNRRQALDRFSVSPLRHSQNPNIDRGDQCVRMFFAQ